MTLSTSARAIAIGDFARSTRKELQNDFALDMLLVNLTRSARRVLKGCQDGQSGDAVWYFIELYLEQLYLAFGARAFELLTPEEQARLDNSLYATRVMLTARLEKYPYARYLAKAYRESQYIELTPDAQKEVWLDAHLRLTRFDAPLPQSSPREASGVFTTS